MIRANSDLLPHSEANGRTVDQRLVAVCAWCERIRTENGEWKSADQGSAAQVATQSSHSICPTCAEDELRIVSMLEAADAQSLENGAQSPGQ